MDINLLLLSLFSLCLLFVTLCHFCDKKKETIILDLFIGLNIHCMHDSLTFTLLLLSWFDRINELIFFPTH